jgi:hypothetical protein
MRTTSNPDHLTHSTGREIIYFYELRISVYLPDKDSPELTDADVNHQTAEFDHCLR